MMVLSKIFTDSTVARYVKTMRESPKEVIFNRRMLVSAAIYAMTAMCSTWDQGSSSTIPSLPGFSQAFGITTATDPGQVSNFISFVFLTAGVGSLLSFFVNDRIGRLWSMRLYFAIWIVGQLIATFSYGNMRVLLAARFVSGLGIGPLTVTGPMSIVEIAPTEARGLLSVWYSVVLLLSVTVATLTVYACYLHLAATHLQYQIVFFAPTIAAALVIAASFRWCSESPRWLMLVGRHDKAIETLVSLRGLPAEHPRVAGEINSIRSQIEEEHAKYGSGGSIKTVLKETFLVPSNLRRVQQSCLAYALAQLSGANSITSYLVPILSLIGTKGGTSHSLFISSMYSLSKLFYTMMASFFFVDALGRRMSLFIGIAIQIISDVYIGVYLKFSRSVETSSGASEGAIAAIFIHGFGWAIGLLVLPYVFGAELWPNNIRSFGSALSQAFHWLFFFGVLRATPSILKSMDQWGAFIFFACWCLLSWIYVYFAVPETSGMPIEQLDELFEGPWWKAYKTAKKSQAYPISDQVADIESNRNSIGTDAGNVSKVIKD